LPPSTKTLRLSVLELRVITFPIGYRWKCVRGYCACAESRDPWVGGQKWLHIWNPRPRLAYSLCNFYWATTTIKGRLLSSRPMVKPFSGEKNSVPSKWGPKWRFLGKWGSKPWILVLRPPKGTSLRGTASFDVFCVKIGARVSTVAFLKNPKKQNSWVTLCRGARNHACAEPKTPKPIWIKILHGGRYPDVVTYTNFGDHRLRGFWVAEVKLPPLPLTFIVRASDNKKLSYRRGTAWCVVSVEILPITTQQCRNYLYYKSRTKYQLSLIDPCDKIVL